MSTVSVTRLRLRSAWHLLPFLRANEAVARQLTGSTGFLRGGELIDARFTFWTLTAWESPEAVRQFRNGPPHRQAMQRISAWCSEGAYAQVELPDLAYPDWDTARQLLVADTRWTPIRFPSADHAARHIPPIRWRRLQRPLTPRRS